MDKLENLGFEESEAFKADSTIDYVTDSIATKVIVRKPSGSVSIMAFDDGQLLKGKFSPFDALLQVIEGKTSIIIEGKTHKLEHGQSIIIPANSRNTIVALSKLKLIRVIIKSEYEEVI